VPSYTNRALRASEVEGVDKCRRPLPVMAMRAIEGYFLELEENRPGFFYTTPAEFTPGKQYVKDVELRGALRLKGFMPEIPVIVPLPPLRMTSKRTTEWERRVVTREGYGKNISQEALDKDLPDRLAGVVQEGDDIQEFHLVEDPYTLFIVNDDLATSVETMLRFLATGEKGDQSGIEAHIQSLKQLAVTALDAA